MPQTKFGDIVFTFISRKEIVVGTVKDVFDEMSDKWPSEIIARTEIKVFTGGLISPGYLANLDSRGEGPIGRIKVGRKTSYRKKSLVKWLRERSKIYKNY